LNRSIFVLMLFLVLTNLLARAADAAKKPTVNWMMQIQIDSVWSGQDENSREEFGVIPDGAAFRRARFGMFGDYGPWEYRIAMDFALSGHPSFIDVFGELAKAPDVDVVAMVDILTTRADRSA
jgi:phosphate-selective porin OprO/OprP